MGETQRYARVPAEMSRAGWRRAAPHVATAGAVQGRGASIAGALDELGANLAAMAARAHGAPVFFWDADNSQLWVVVTNPVTGDWSSSIVRFTDGAPSVSLCTSSGGGPASEAYSNAIGMARVTSHGTERAPQH